MKITSYKIVATLVGLSFSVAGNALAEDGYGYGYQAAPQAQVQAQVPQQADSNYVVPPSYQGQYYPQETEGAVAYHGTSNSSSNAAKPSEDPYYLYYY